MSSSVKADSLSELSVLLAKVDEALRDKRACTYKKYQDLQEWINFLQVACPNHAGVLNARVKWFEWGLERLELYIEAIQAKPPSEWVCFITYHASKSENLVWARTETLEHFLKRAYLKEYFPEMYTRLIALYVKIASLTQTSHPGLFTNKMNQLELTLLKGQF